MKIVASFFKGRDMVRGGKREGAGRKPLGRVALTVRISPTVRRRIERHADQNNAISLTKQAEQWLSLAAEQPEWLDPTDMRGWNGTHLRALGRLTAHVAGRVEAVMGFKPIFGGKAWSEDLAATRAVRVAFDAILEMTEARLPGQLDPKQAER